MQNNKKTESQPSALEIREGVYITEKVNTE